MKKMNLLIATSAVALMVAAPAQSAGFKILEKSSTLLGQAFAGAGATTNDVSALGFNIAAASFMDTGAKGFVAGASLSYIMPKAEFTADVNNTLLAGNAETKKNAFVPAFYALWKANEKISLGINVTAPFGLATEYAANSNVRFSALKSSLKTININPFISYKINEMISVALGVQAQYADVDLSKATDPSANLPGLNPFATIGEFKTEAQGTDWGFGLNAAIFVNPWKDGRFGLTYQSHVRHKLKGDIKNTGAGTTAPAFAGLLVNNIFDTTKNITAALTTPESVGVHYAHDITDKLTVGATAEWTRWSRYDTQIVILSNSSDRGAGAANDVVGSPEPQNWSNVWFLAIGGTYKLNDAWNLRMGVAYDQTPTNNTDRSARLPGNDRTWVSAGVEWTPMADAKVGLSYTHVFVRDTKIDQTNVFGNRTSGTFKNCVDIIGLQANYKF